jgi:CheY-like chemotaxis protein
MLTFWLNDNGTGLTLEQLTKFNHFFADPLRSFSKGAGYGLTLVKALVHLMKGSVWVTFEKSVGTTFYFRIPFIPIDTLLYLDSMKVFDEGHSQRIEYNKLKGKTILIYEMHPNDYILTRSMLEGTGCTLVFANSMEKMLNVSLGFEGISMALVSVSILSNIDIDTIKKVRDLNIEMPIIANITYNVEKREKYQSAGFTDVIERPSSRGQLIYKLLEFIG